MSFRGRIHLFNLITEVRKISKLKSLQRLVDLKEELCLLFTGLRKVKIS